MEFNRLWRIILGHKWMIIVVTLSSTLVAVALTYVLPQIFEATALVLVRPGEKINLVSNSRGRELLDFPVSQSSPVDAPSKTYMEVIQSRAVAEKIVTALGLHLSEPQPYEGFWKQLKDDIKTFVKEWRDVIRDILLYGRIVPISPFEEAVKKIQENLVLEVKKNTYVFVIIYGSSDPKEAADVANMAAEIFLEHNADAYRKESTRLREFLDQRLIHSEAELESVRQQLLSFKGSTGTFLLNEEYAEDLKILGELRTDLAKTEAARAGMVERYSASSTRVTSLDAEMQTLRATIASVRQKLDRHPDKEKTLETLKLAVRVASDNYELMRKKYEEAAIQELKVVDEIRIVSSAVVPVYPSKPLKYIYGLLGFVLALALSTTGALFLEYLHPKVRTIDDLTADLNLPFLGAIPRI